MRSTPRQTAARRVLRALVLTCLAAVLPAPDLAAQRPPVANGHALLTDAVALVRTQAYGIDDGHVFEFLLPDRCAVEVSALQWALWRDDRRADFVTVFGIDSAAGRRQLYQRIEGFPPGTTQLRGDNTLTLAGQTYPPSLVAMLPRSEIAAQFPELDLSRLAPRQPTDQYAVVAWEDVIYANGRHFGVGFALTEEDAFNDLFGRPGRSFGEYMTLCVDCPGAGESHRFLVSQAGLEVVGAHYQRDIGTGFHTEVLSVIGLASGLVDDAWTGMRGFEPALVELRGDSIMTDAVGLEHVSVPRLLSAEQVAAEFPQMDLSNLAGGGLYVVDYWPAVQMALPDEPSEIWRVSGSVRVNGQPRAIEVLGVSRGTVIGEQVLTGLLKIDGVPPPPEELIPGWLLPIQPSGGFVDSPLGILTQPGDRARMRIRIGNNSSPIRGVLFEDVVVVSVDPWVTDVEFSGNLQVSDDVWALPFAKAGMDFTLESNMRGNGVALLLGVSQGTSVEIPVTYAIRFEGTPTRELPARFLGSMTLDGYSPATGAFSGTLVRQEAAP